MEKDEVARDTIAAIATPIGQGGIGVVRLSGPKVREIAQALTGRLPKARKASLCLIRDARGERIDEGIVLYFPAPHSYTGEAVLELQGHGGPVVMQAVLAACLDAGARLAEPGEFTRRAFLEGKLDLAQAEAVADLIDAASREAARSALRSLKGEFSAAIGALNAQLIELRALVEAMLDFPEEELDRLHVDDAAARLARVRAARIDVFNKADLAPGFLPPATEHAAVVVSAKTGVGLDELRGAILHAAGWASTGESLFLARERHLRALERARSRLQAAAGELRRWEFFAEELRLAQNALGSITGEFTADDLLGEIFARFCIGK